MPVLLCALRFRNQYSLGPAHKRLAIGQWSGWKGNGYGMCPEAVIEGQDTVQTPLTGVSNDHKCINIRQPK